MSDKQNSPSPALDSKPGNAHRTGSKIVPVTQTPTAASPSGGGGGTAGSAGAFANRK